MIYITISFFKTVGLLLGFVQVISTKSQNNLRKEGDGSDLTIKCNYFKMCWMNVALWTWATSVLNLLGINTSLGTQCGRDLTGR